MDSTIGNNNNTGHNNSFDIPLHTYTGEKEERKNRRTSRNSPKIEYVRLLE
jgi:hypothetical protein